MKKNKKRKCECRGGMRKHRGQIRALEENQKTGGALWGGHYCMWPCRGDKWWLISVPVSEGWTEYVSQGMDNQSLQGPKESTLGAVGLPYAWLREVQVALCFLWKVSLEWFNILVPQDPILPSQASQGEQGAPQLISVVRQYGMSLTSPVLGLLGKGWGGQRHRGFFSCKQTARLAQCCCVPVGTR